MRFIDEMSQAEVAKRLGISQMHVSRLQRAATEQLREQMAAEAQEALE
jgi:RNA polymerase sigma-B factor